MNTVKPLTERERKERDRLHTKWATGRPTKKEMERCMDLDSRAEAWLRQTEAWLRQQTEGK